MELQGLEKRFCSSALWRIATQRAVIPWIVSFTDGELPTDADVLEVGSGGGFNAETFLRRFPNWRLTATDYDPEMVELARRRLTRFGDRVALGQADATALPFANASFDVVLSIGVLHHVGAWEKALIEAARVLRPGGALVAVDLLDRFFIGPLRRAFPPVRTYTSLQVLGELPRAGFVRYRLHGGRLWYRLLGQTAPRP
ncbi:MAG TPA: class I SAM-dependent methyltransferase [Actinomycetota bacterium]|nr:class I SAM-dependent methyltransferase [Actinomycetota bacterium]